jgi:hypothetical protein
VYSTSMELARLLLGYNRLPAPTINEELYEMRA